tara:strand:- start:556 stop:1815 length:1260 start_codon:yes stop_codon:yes gene_type:complete
MELARLLISKIKNSTKIKIFKKFIFEFPYYFLDFSFIAVSLLKNIIQHQKIYKKNLVIVTASDKFFANSLFQLLENLKLQDELQEVIVYDLGMTQEQVNKLYSKYPDVNYKRFEFDNYPAFFKEVDGYGKMGAYAWKPSIIWEVLNEYKCQVVWLDTGNLINSKFKFVRIVLSNIGFFSPISAGNIKDYTHKSTLKNLNFPEKFKNKKMLTGGFCCFDWDNEESKELLNNWKMLSSKKELIFPHGSTPYNHKHDQSLLTLLTYSSKNYSYIPKIKKVFGIKVNQNPGRYFYLLEGSKNSKASQFREEWYKKYKTISTLTIKDAEIIWITSLINIDRVKIKLLKKNKVIYTSFSDENFGLIKDSKKFSLNRRNKFIDIYLTTESDFLNYLEEKNKKVIFLESDEINYIKLKLSEVLQLNI